MSKIKSKPKKNYHEGHRDRMRARYILGKGLDAFADHEIIEMLLFYDIRRQNTNLLAHKALERFGNNLHALFNADPKVIRQKTGLSENAAVLLSLVPHLAKRHHYSSWGKKIIFANTESLGSYLKIPFIGKSTECFFMMCLDSRMGLKSAEMLEQGTLDWVELYPGKIVEYALANGASYVVFAHNHPSGDLRVSEADIISTLSIVRQLRPFNITVLDHFVIAGDSYISFAENGLLRLAGIGSNAD
jgi:DNA repair protein RadC